MLIERHIDKVETAIVLDLDKYIFSPNENGDLVCDVGDKGHCQLLLAIPEAFQLYGEQARAEYEEIEATRFYEQAMKTADDAAKAAKAAASKAAIARDQAKERQQAIIDKKASDDSKEDEEATAIEEAKMRQAAEKELARKKSAALAKLNATKEGADK